jgi:hypothetical protein
MGTCRLTREQYDLLVEAYREKPDNFSNAARHAGCELRTARKGWREGWTNPPWATRPIRQILQDEQARVRAQLYEVEKERQETAGKLREERAKAELDAREERSREAQAVRAAMSASMSALAVSGQVSRARLTVAQRAADSIVQAAGQGQLTWQLAVGLLTKLQWLDERAVATLKTSMEILRLHTGEPSEFMKASAYDVAKVDGKQAAEVLGGESVLKQAIIDLANDKITPDVERLIEYQLNADRTHH